MLFLGAYIIVSLCWVSIEKDKHEQIIDVQYKSHPLNNHQINLPQSAYYEKLGVKQRYTYIYIGYPKGDTASSKEPRVIIHENEEGSFSELLQNLHQIVYTDLHNWNVNPCLLIDKDVPMEYVKSLQMELRRLNKVKVIYAIRKKMSWSNIPFGIHSLLPPLSEEEYESSLIKYPKQTPKTFIPPPSPPPQPEILNEPTLHLKINDFNQITVNGKEVTLEGCSHLIHNFTTTYPKQGVLTWESSDKATYNEYIQLLAAIRLNYQTNRNQTALKKYGKPYEVLEKKEQRVIRELHPMRFKELW